MARPLRIEYPEAWYHVTCRGNEKRNIFRDEAEREKFLKILSDNLKCPLFAHTRPASDRPIAGYLKSTVY
jgi:hypothetical protein